MNVRIASAIDHLVGGHHERIEIASRSRRISFIAIRLSHEPLDLGEHGARREARRRGTCARAGAPRPGACRSRPKTFSSHHRATSGNESSRSVSPVGAQSTITTSQLVALEVALELEEREELIDAGGDGELFGGDAVHAPVDEQLAEPARTADQWRSSSSWAWTCCAQRPSPTCGRLGADLFVSSDSASECAGSVDSTMVRLPAAAQRRAVAAATEVFPTPPLPV